MKHILKEGDTGRQVKDIQHWLNAHGYKAGEEDGIFGEKTRDAVIQFQSAKKIVTDGIIGSQTQLTIERIEKEE
ncbi:MULTISPECIES: peptidoglycan-binding domain-containing protein [Methanobacterium]|jgi:peptidoglycan hydrolase-like protein with peptidoglycan-binding domain|uniref:Peptidoglycan-binding domain-containing protein n=1 Tax=Methanobacterium veterum TaxID=408577 RepID=A0A9E5DNC9_9EURY|nr:MULTISPECIES: peptidoglycan-binding domain-containing protein [Methanobacterium]MCZ3365709.1 peptidoglycan-binding domain-containing protein [Methanobacterium veterum]MCZ3371173.1 peptidoglycan-binding domain-containing protein [Methanobacterium veterum]